MKENLQVDPESLVSNFLSNLTFFRRYKDNIFGFTGTLGSVDNMKNLAQYYQVDFGFVPTFRQSLMETEKQAQAQIKPKQLNKRRAVLIISETISEAQQVYEIVKSNYPENQLKLYVDSDETIENIIFDSGNAIISTNLAGRGIDLKLLASVEENGGLHMMITFLPQNSRIQDQAFGRTARQGRKGSVQLVLDYTSKSIENGLYVSQIKQIAKMQDLKQDLPTIELPNEQKLLSVRDEYETQVIQKAQKDCEDILLRDSLFADYCNTIPQKVLQNKYKFRDIENKFAL